MTRNQIIANESRVRVIGPRDKGNKAGAINCCSNSDNWTRMLSPFELGPVKLLDGRVSYTMENAWQYSKVYEGYLAKDGHPIWKWFEWSKVGFDKQRAVRYPMGKGAKPLGLWHNEQLIGYVPARKAVYWPLYRDAVRKMPAWRELQRLFEHQGTVTLWDFDGYERGNTTLCEVVNDPDMKMGHAFVLAAMLLYGQTIEPGNLP